MRCINSLETMMGSLKTPRSLRVINSHNYWKTSKEHHQMVVDGIIGAGDYYTHMALVAWMSEEFPEWFYY